MTQWWVPWPVTGRDVWTRGLLVLLRATTSVSLLFAAYFVIPARTAEKGFGLPWLILELAVFGLVVGVQVPAIVGAKHPVLRAVESLAVLIPLYLLIFARIYLSNSLNDPSGFSEPLDHATALYFTVTVFATVGFGDIVAQTNSMRLLVTVQMLLNLAMLGLVIRLLTSAARRGVARRGAETDLGERDVPLA
jgi:hypothetical protein